MGQKNVKGSSVWGGVQRIIIQRLTKQKKVETMSRPKGLPKTGGRQKGTPNHATAELRQWLERLLNSKRCDFEKAFSGLDEREYVRSYMALLNFILPKMQVAATEQPSDSVTDSLPLFEEGDIVELVHLQNDSRAAKGLPPLQLDVVVR